MKLIHFANFLDSLIEKPMKPQLHIGEKEIEKSLRFIILDGISSEMAVGSMST